MLEGGSQDGAMPPWVLRPWATRVMEMEEMEEERRVVPCRVGPSTKYAAAETARRCQHSKDAAVERLVRLVGRRRARA